VTVQDTGKVVGEAAGSTQVQGKEHLTAGIQETVLPTPPPTPSTTPPFTPAHGVQSEGISPSTPGEDNTICAAAAAINATDPETPQPAAAADKDHMQDVSTEETKSSSETDVPEKSGDKEPSTDNGKDGSSEVAAASPTATEPATQNGNAPVGDDSPSKPDASQSNENELDMSVHGPNIAQISQNNADIVPNAENVLQAGPKPEEPNDDRDKKEEKSPQDVDGGSGAGHAAKEPEVVVTPADMNGNQETEENEPRGDQPREDVQPGQGPLNGNENIAQGGDDKGVQGDDNSNDQVKEKQRDDPTAEDKPQTPDASPQAAEDLSGAARKPEQLTPSKDPPSPGTDPPFEAGSSSSTSDTSQGM
jgi:hypothetical protein